MINGKDNPVEWALLAYEIEEVVEHLQDLSNEVIPGSGIDETEFNIQLGHIYSHINRIWNSRNHTGEFSKEDHDKYSEFPTDLNIYG